MKRTVAFIILISLFMNFSFSAFAADSGNKNDESDEIPQSLQDFRRFEIITLGAMPFVTLDVTLGYSMEQYAEDLVKYNQNGRIGQKPTFPNPFKTSSNGGYNDDEIKGIIITSLCISLGIGITDLIVRIIKRNRVQTKKNKSKLNIITIEDDPDAIKIEAPDNHKENEDDSADEVILLDEELSVEDEAIVEEAVQ